VVVVPVKRAPCWGFNNLQTRKTDQICDTLTDHAGGHTRACTEVNTARVALDDDLADLVNIWSQQ